MAEDSSTILNSEKFRVTDFVSEGHDEGKDDSDDDIG